jgi:septum site-determining protein MinD
LGVGLALEGKKVCLVDADIGLRNLDVIMGLENRSVYDLVNVIEGTCRLKQALIKDKKCDELYLLPAAQTRDKNAVTPEQMSKLCQSLCEMGFDYILIDCPAGIEQGFKNAVSGANKAIVVATPEISSVRDADRIIGMLEANDIKSPLLILNRVRKEMVEHCEMMSPTDVCEILAIEMLGLIPEDDNVIISSNRGEALICNNKSVAGKEFGTIVKRILGEDIPIENINARKTFLQYLKSFLLKE